MVDIKRMRRAARGTPAAPGGGDQRFEVPSTEELPAMAGVPSSPPVATPTMSGAPTVPPGAPVLPDGASVPPSPAAPGLGTNAAAPTPVPPAAAPAVSVPLAPPTDELRFEGVMLCGSTPQGPSIVQGLALLIDARGLTVAVPGSPTPRTTSWDRISSLQWHRPVTLPDGSSGSSLALTLAGRPIEFRFPAAVIPLAAVDDVASRVWALASRYGTPSAAPAAITAPLAAGAATGAAVETVGAWAPPAAETPLAAGPAAASIGAHPAGSALGVAPDVEEATTHAGVPAVAGAAVTGAVAETLPPEATPDAPVAGGEPGDAGLAVGKTHRRSRRRLFVLVLLLLLAAGAAGGWYWRKHHQQGSTTPTASSAPPPAAPTDPTVAASAGIQSSDLTGWKAQGANPGSAFAGVSSTSLADHQSASAATATLARCLGIPTSQVAGAIGTSSAGTTAQVGSPLYVDDAGDSASSLVTMVPSLAAAQSSFAVFGDAAKFATCDAAYVHSVLPFVSGPPDGARYTSATVTPLSVASSNPGVRVVAFRVVRNGTLLGKAVTQTTTVVAMTGGRIEVTLGTTSTGSFPAAIQNALVQSLAGRVAANDMH